MPDPTPRPEAEAAPPPGGAALLFIVSQAHDIDGLCVLLSPGAADGAAPPGCALRLRRPDGVAFVLTTVGKSVPHRPEPHAGRRAYPIQVQALLPASEIPEGTEVWRIDAPSAPSAG